MFEELRDALESLEVAPGGDALVELHRLHGILDAKTAAAVAAFDSSGEWASDGSVSMSAWMRVRLRMSHGDASQLLKTSRLARSLPLTSQAWEQGRLSSGQIRVVVANVKTRHVDLFIGDEGQLVPGLCEADITETVSALRRWADIADAIDDGPEPPPPPPTEARLSRSLDGRGHLSGSFDSAETEVIERALDLAGSPDADGEVRTFAQKQGQALADVCRFFLDHQSNKLGKRHRPHLNVVVDLPDLLNGGPGRMLNGSSIDAATLHALACDANLHRVITDGKSSILDYGRSTRTIPAAVYTSLVLRDQHCRYPGCDRKPEWCDGHHIWHWENGGPTKLSNLVLLCSKHHHLIHRRGWHITMDDTGVLEVTAPDGTTRRSHPPQPRLAA
ncbi:MAG TPA: DUF222 domain-containing protein [Acidimicrobiales bacterium]